MPAPLFAPAIWASDPAAYPLGETYPALLPWGDPHPQAGETVEWAGEARRQVGGLAGIVAEGFKPYQEIPAEVLNSWLGLVSEWVNFYAQGGPNVSASQRGLYTDTGGGLGLTKLGLGNGASSTPTRAKVLEIIGKGDGTLPAVLVDSRGVDPGLVLEAGLSVSSSASTSHPSIAASHAATGESAIYGYSNAVAGYGLYGEAIGAGGVGVYGETDSSNGNGVWGHGGDGGDGVVGSSASGWSGNFGSNSTKGSILVGGLSSPPSDVTIGGLYWDTGIGAMCTPNRTATAWRGVFANGFGWTSAAIEGADAVITASGSPQTIATFGINVRAGAKYLVLGVSPVTAPSTSPVSGGTQDIQITKPDLTTEVLSSQAYSIDTVGAGLSVSHSYATIWIPDDTGAHTLRWRTTAPTNAHTFESPVLVAFGDLVSSQ